jgi:hypothetical protein
MRTARMVTFASLFLSLLVACANAGDLGLRVPPQGSSEVPAAVEEAEATGVPAEEPRAPTPLENVANATAASTALLLGSPTASSQDLRPTPLLTFPGQSPAADEYTFDPSLWQASLESLSSFRQKAVLDFTAVDSGIRSKVTYEGEVTIGPSALHSLVRVEGQGTAQLPTSQVEVIGIDDQVWVKVGLRPWESLPATIVQSAYGGQVVGVADLLPFIHNARRALPDETVNGIPSQHYVYDVDNLQTDVCMSSAQGDLWVARDVGFVVRLTLDGQGTYYDTYTVSGKLRLVYDLYDVDIPLTITPPR